MAKDIMHGCPTCGEKPWDCQCTAEDHKRAERKKKKKKVLTGWQTPNKKTYTYLDQDPVTGSKCEHVLVLIEEEPDPTKSVACCKQCPNGWDSETHYTKGKSKKPYRIVRAYKCGSMYRKGSDKVKDPEVIDPKCPYRTMDASEMV